MCMPIVILNDLTAFQDPFKYSYPPLTDDDFQTPISDNGPIVSEDDTESKEGELEVKDALDSSFNSEIAVKPKKVHFTIFSSTLYELLLSPVLPEIS